MLFKYLYTRRLTKKYIRSTFWKINDHQILYTLNIWKNVFRILDLCKSSILLCKSDFCTMFCKHLVFCQRLWEKNSSCFSQFEFIYIYVIVNYDVRFSWGCLIYNLRYKQKGSMINMFKFNVDKSYKKTSIPFMSTALCNMSPINHTTLSNNCLLVDRILLEATASLEMIRRCKIDVL